MVEFTVEKGDGSMFSPEAGGEAKSFTKIQVVAASPHKQLLSLSPFLNMMEDFCFTVIRLQCILPQLTFS